MRGGTPVDEDGMVVLRGWLAPKVGAVLRRALEAALEQVPAAGDDEDGGARVALGLSGVPMRWSWWPRARWPAGSLRATAATASR